MAEETIIEEVVGTESASEKDRSAEEKEEDGRVQLASEPAFQIGEFTVTNTMTATLFTTVLIIILAILIRRKAGIIPSRMQVMFEEVFMMFYEKLDEAVGEKRARRIAPLIVTLFMFVLIANQFILFPFVGSLVTEHGHLFRTPTTDYSMTIALAIITMSTAHILAFIASPLGHVGNYIRVKPFFQIITGKRPIGEIFNAGIEMFLGVLEILGDFIKVISLGTRLFGNLLAGEVVIIVISGLMFATQFFVPIPFILLASFAGLIQAFVFTLLSTLFISNNLVHATSHGEAGGH